MLHLHHSDELDPLLDALATMLDTAPADPFAPDLVVVPTAGIADAAKVGLGCRLGAEGSGYGVVANVEFLFPGRFVARALGKPNASSATAPIDPWQIDQLTWYVLEELTTGSVEVPGADTSNLWALARRVADLFDRYATQRPRLIEHWAAGQYTDGTYSAQGELSPLGPDHHWQVQLWQRVRQRIAAPSPPELLPGLLTSLRDGGLVPSLPQRVSLFGLGSVPPNLLAVLRALAEVRDVHVLLRHSSRAAWADSPHRLAGGLTQRALVNVTSHVHHPLLESWGRPALETKALVGGASDIAESGYLPHLAEPGTLLSALQHGIRLDTPPAMNPSITATDASLQVHACHGEVRQLEVLRDALGHAFVADPTLQPHDVQVLCGDLERFAPLVEAVFARGALPVPVRIGDRSLTTDDPVGSALQSVLELVVGRATLSEVLALVQHEPVRRRFGWSIEQVEQLAEWCSTLGTRWGLSVDHRLEWGLPEQVTTGTWSAMVDRLMAGVAMPAPSPRLGLGDVPPFDDMGTDHVQLAGTVADMVRRLTLLQSQVQQPKPISEWAELLHHVIDDFCAFDPLEPWRRQRVHRQVEQLVDTARRSSAGPAGPAGSGTAEVCDIPLSFAEMRSALVQVLSDSPGRLSLRSGSVTVTSFVPQHGVPARVVCILGLDENALRSGVFDGDDVLGLRPCLGERHPRFESRQLLLDAVLSARERLIITCNGADLTTNKEMPLVVALAELLDVVGRIVPLDKHHAPVVVRHPRHGFSERALRVGTLVEGADVPFTFDPAMLEAALARRAAQSADSRATASPWLLDPAIVQSVDLQQLIDAVTNPSKVYLRDRLDVRLPDEAEGVDDGLPISVDNLTKSTLGRSLLDVYRSGRPATDWFEAARLDGTLPPGELHRAALDEVVTDVNGLVELAASAGVPLIGPDRLDVNVSVEFGETEGFAMWRPRFTMPLSGVVSGLVLDPVALGGTLVQVRYSRSRPSHRFALALQLAALQVQKPFEPWSAVLIDRGVTKPSAIRLRLRGQGGQRTKGAHRILLAATQLYLWAMHDAVPLFDRASAALAAGDFEAAEKALERDLNDQWIRALWPGLSLERLRLDPPLPGDPAVLAPFDSVPPSASRAELVAKWLWRTYESVVAEGDDIDDPDDPDTALGLAEGGVE